MAVVAVLAWVGYALATTPPKPIEEVEKEVQKALEEIENTNTTPGNQRRRLQPESDPKGASRSVAAGHNESYRQTQRRHTRRLLEL